MKFPFQKYLHILLIFVVSLYFQIPVAKKVDAADNSAFRIDIRYANCYDGIDNDDDGKKDFPLDPDCTSETDNSESPLATVSFSGLAYPLSKVSVLKDGVVSVETIAGPDAKFTAYLNGLVNGSYNFAVRSEDEAGRISSLFSFTMYVSDNTSTFISGIFLSPTLGLSKTNVKKGEDIQFSGKTVPNSDLMIEIHSPEQILLYLQSNNNGDYNIIYNTAPLTEGAHTAKSQSSTTTEVSTFSEVREFSVDIPDANGGGVEPTCRVADLNCDGRVNLVDFSIEAYWYQRPSPPAEYDLNKDNLITIIDFSIMAFHWTG